MFGCLKFYRLIIEKLDLILIGVNKMTADIGTLDSAIATENQLITEYVAAVTALVAKVPPSPDYTNELEAVQTGSKAITTALAAIQPAPQSSSQGSSAPSS